MTLMTASPKKRTVEEDLRARGIDPKFVKFGRLVGRNLPKTLEMTVQRAAIGGRALDTADTLYVGIEQQLARLSAVRPDDSLQDVLAYGADVDLALVLLLRLRRAAVLIKTHVEGGDRLKDAIAAFDSAVPDLKQLRDIYEHFDDYILGKGHQKPGSGIGRSISYKPGNAPVIARGQQSVDLSVGLIAARRLYEEIYHATVGHSSHLTGTRASHEVDSKPPPIGEVKEAKEVKG